MNLKKILLTFTLIINYHCLTKDPCDLKIEPLDKSKNIKKNNIEINISDNQIVLIFEKLKIYINTEIEEKEKIPYLMIKISCFVENKNPAIYGYRRCLNYKGYLKNKNSSKIIQKLFFDFYKKEYGGDVFIIDENINEFLIQNNIVIPLIPEIEKSLLQEYLDEFLNYGMPLIIKDLDDFKEYKKNITKTQYFKKNIKVNLQKTEEGFLFQLLASKSNNGFYLEANEKKTHRAILINNCDYVGNFICFKEKNKETFLYLLKSFGLSLYNKKIEYKYNKKEDSLLLYVLENKKQKTLINVIKISEYILQCPNYIEQLINNISISLELINKVFSYYPITLTKEVTKNIKTDIELMKKDIKMTNKNKLLQSSEESFFFHNKKKIIYQEAFNYDLFMSLLNLFIT